MADKESDGKDQQVVDHFVVDQLSLNFSLLFSRSFSLSLSLPTSDFLYFAAKLAIRLDYTFQTFTT